MIEAGVAVKELITGAVTVAVTVTVAVSVTVPPLLEAVRV
jgi:hypothetical protein